ncbi:C-X-C chemokine receptor type 3-2 [Megalops cyprinoides]|uniref:C-X-C chemokine receptor type 3-2 n=1 Tax=Megalops cyprinoides TaxID=118141 RepID=UPI00186400D6|nr:C-X-C chemokine receptor type 3-2 [Megalops cyprinoides]XP_036394140.1 C-X-C chemokine receptor type 3-2 [Megalops cyprinoides]XP_036394141.1 C-X-C chemokine receptor type 3-2 [Megalops cyprinoides]XP_036394142.1 C-X-C chemokine receptor type 3-2 [Megalops cyprinoides]
MTTPPMAMTTTEEYMYYEDYTSLVDTDMTYATPCSPQHSWQFAGRFCPVVYSLVFVLAVVGNTLVLCVVRRYRTSRNSPCSFSLTDTFLLHLAVSDLLLALTLPFYAVQWAKEWVFGEAGCKIASAVFSLNLYSSILFLACISFDRYLAIVHAITTGWRRNGYHAQIACAVIWVACFALASIDLQYGQVVKLPRSEMHVCYHQLPEGGLVGLQLLNLVVGFALPLLVMLYCYVRIFRSLCHASRRQKRKSLRLIISLVAVFVLCWAPYNGFQLTDSLLRLGVIEHSCSLDDALDIGTFISESLGLTHCALNPLLYGFVGIKFRKELMQMWKGLLGSWGFLGLDGWGQRQERRRAGGSFSSDSENTSYFSVVV